MTAEAVARANGWPHTEGHAIGIRIVDRYGEEWFRAVCSCRYRSGLHGFIGHAEAAGQAHVEAKR